MFHEGTLQDGVSKAVQESKSVLCFVTDHDTESMKWEDEWLQDQNIPSVIERQAIALRLEAGSEEAGYLSAFCPLSKIPTIVVIHQGQLSEQLNNGLTKNEFTLRLLRSLNRSKAPSSNTTTQSSQPQAQPSRPAHISSSSQPSSAPSSTSQSPAPQTPSSVQDTSSTSESTPKSRRSNEKSYSQQQAQRKREEKQELERIRQNIKNDHIERQRREEQRRREAQAEAEQKPLSAAENDAPISSEPARVAPLSISASASESSYETARIQVRLSDGNTLRKTFSSDVRLTSIREWIDTERTDGTTAYTLKEVLTPLPSRAIPAAEESQTLAQLNLAPSAALVTVPTKGRGPIFPAAASSTAQTSGAGILNTAQHALSALWGWIVAVLVAVAAAVRTFLGLDGTPQRGPAEAALPADRASSAVSPAPATTVETWRAKGKGKERAAATATDAVGAGAGAGSPGIRIRTLRDRRESDTEARRKSQGQLYNGNQLNFEPSARDNGSNASGNGGGAADDADAL